MEFYQSEIRIRSLDQGLEPAIHSIPSHSLFNESLIILYIFFHNSVKHFKIELQTNYTTDHYNSYVNRTRNCTIFFSYITCAQCIHLCWYGRNLVVEITTLFNILGHQRCFRHWVWKVRQISLRGSNFGLRFFYVPLIYDTGPTALLSFRRKSYSGFLRSEKIHWLRPGLNPLTSNPEASMITPRPPGSTAEI